MKLLLLFPIIVMKLLDYNCLTSGYKTLSSTLYLAAVKFNLVFLTEIEPPLEAEYGKYERLGGLARSLKELVIFSMLLWLFPFLLCKIGLCALFE